MDPIGPINSINTPQDSGAPNPQDQMLQDLQTLRTTLDDPHASQDEKAKLIEKIEENISANRGAFSNQARREVLSCVDKAQHHLAAEGLDDSLNHAIDLISGQKP